MRGQSASKCMPAFCQCTIENDNLNETDDEKRENKGFVQMSNGC